MKNKNCPFCDSDDLSLEEKDTDGWGIHYHSWIECQTCGAKGPVSIFHHDEIGEDKTWEKWNSRVKPTPGEKGE